MNNDFRYTDPFLQQQRELSQTYYNGDACGLYTPQTQLELDPSMLGSLGFNEAQIEALKCAIMNFGKVTQSKLLQVGFNQDDANTIKYMYDICIGRVRVETMDDWVKHLRKTFGKYRRITMEDLMTSRVSDIPRIALVGDIPPGPFEIYNSKNYPKLERFYKVINVTGSNIVVETDRLPIFKYKEDRFIEGIISVVEKTKKNTVVLSINKKYCKLCNRFIVAASLRRPEFYLSMYELLCCEGTRVYVYATTVPATEKAARYHTQSQRVYSYGYYPNEIKNKVMTVAAELYKRLAGVKALEHIGNTDYTILPIENTQEEDIIEIEG